MYMDLPNIRRCCFCIPLRHGLLAWAYFKLAWCLIISTLICVRLSVASQKEYFTATMLIIPLVYCTILVIEFFITIVFIIGAHKKNPKFLRVYYIYGLVMLGIIFLIFLFGAGLAVLQYLIQMQHIYLINMYETTLFGTGVILFNLYVLSLVRSEILKLENNTQFNFQNNLDDPKCTMEETDVSTNY